MNLFLYPQAASLSNGYGIGVDFAYKKNTPAEDDVVVWYTSFPKEKMLHLRESDYIIKRKNSWSLSAIMNLLTGKTHAELSVGDLAFLKGKDFDNIYCDEVIFYRALRKLYPEKRLVIRYHNCFSRIWVRTCFLKRKLGMKYWLNLRLLKKLETEIFSDRNVFKIFISDEDRDFYCSTYGITSDSETWQYVPNMRLIKENRTDLRLSNQLVWFGGLDSHKVSSVEWFIKDVYPQLKNNIPNIEFHLWGGGTEIFEDPHNKIFGHGFYDGDGLPMKDALYINPDIIGGGIKLKLMSLMEKGAAIITTPFGFEGYKNDLIEPGYCNVVEEHKWVDVITQLLTSHQPV